MSRTVQIGVELADNQTVLQISTTKATTGKDLLEATAAALGGIPETEINFFGFLYTDHKQWTGWFKLTKRVWKELGVKLGSPVQPKVQLRVKFYPEDVTREVDPYSMTLKLLYLQVREKVKAKEIDCSFEVSQELARTEINCKIRSPGIDTGFGQQRMTVGPTTPTNYSFKFTHGQVASSPADINAMLAYLEIAQRLPTYGITYFDGKLKTGTVIYLGIGAYGVLIRHANNAEVESKLDWAAIQNIQFNDRKLIISFIDKSTPTLVLFFSHLRTCKRILTLAMGSHHLYLKRRDVGGGAAGGSHWDNWRELDGRTYNAS